MDLMFSAAVVALFTIAAVAAWPAMYAVWSRAIGDAHQLNFWRVAQRRGITTEDTLGKEREVVRATHRCIACQDVARCDVALDSGREDEIAAYCPNHSFLAAAAKATVRR